MSVDADRDRPRVVVVGSTMMELIAYVEKVPVPGQTVEGTEFRMGFGGKGANQAVMTAALGAEVIFVNRVGADLFGEMTRQHLSESGIDARGVSVVDGLSTGVAPIWVDSEGVNRIVVVTGANRALTAEVVRAELDAISGADCVICQLEIPQAGVAEAFRTAREWGAPTILNPAPGAPVGRDVLSLADWLIPNESEFEVLYGEPVSDQSLRRAAQDTPGGIVVTLGAEGAMAVEGRDVVRIAPPRVTSVDTTGAGDAFIGGFAFALASGKGVREAMRLGNACGALSVTSAGTQTSFPTSAAVSEHVPWLGDSASDVSLSS